MACVPGLAILRREVDVLHVLDHGVLLDILDHATIVRRKDLSGREDLREREFALGSLDLGAGGDLESRGSREEADEDAKDG